MLPMSLAKRTKKQLNAQEQGWERISLLTESDVIFKAYLPENADNTNSCKVVMIN